MVYLESLYTYTFVNEIAVRLFKLSQIRQGGELSYMNSTESVVMQCHSVSVYVHEDCSKLQSIREKSSADV